jgi:hypothetical protein
VIATVIAFQPLIRDFGAESSRKGNLIEIPAKTVLSIREITWKILRL